MLWVGRGSACLGHLPWASLRLTLLDVFGLEAQAETLVDRVGDPWWVGNGVGPKVGLFRMNRSLNHRVGSTTIW